MINSNAIIEINKKNLIYNYYQLSKIAKNSICAATVKANAYGLGDVEIVRLLYKKGCNHFFIATTEEGIKIRKINKKIKLYVLNGLESNKLDVFNKYNLIPILNSKEELDFLTKNINLGVKIKFGIHIETGLNRLGIDPKYIKKNLIEKINIEIVISHLASSDKLKSIYNKKQNLKFIKSLSLFKNIKYKSLAASSGIINNIKLHHNMVRPGIALYGSCDNDILKKRSKIKPVILLKGKILQIKEINKNEYVGYDQTFKTLKKIKVAIIGIGYADGISRIMSNNGKLFYKKDKFKIIGRISMDSITVDITDSKYQIQTGQYMAIINERYTIDEMALNCGTIGNEVLTSISNRVKRIYI